MFSPTLSVCATYFLVKRSLVLGLAAAGTALGAIAFPILLENLFEPLGFGGAVRVVGYTSIGLLAIANLITRPRVLPPRPHVPLLPMLGRIIRQPSMWLVCVGSFGVMTGLFIPLITIVSFAKSNGGNATLAKYSVSWTRRLPLLRRNWGLTRVLLQLSIINAAAFFARIGAGILADRYGTFNVVLPSCALLSIMCFAMYVLHTLLPHSPAGRNS